MKATIFLSRVDEKPEVRGMWENTRVLVPLTVHEGPKTVKDKGAQIVMTPKEAVTFALDILGQCPFSVFEGDAELRARLDKMNRIATVVEKQMKDISDLTKGTRFKFDHQPTDVYEFIEAQYDGKNNLDNCTIRRVAYKMDGVWHPDERAGEQNCNPYAVVEVVVFDIR